MNLIDIKFAEKSRIEFPDLVAKRTPGLPSSSNFFDILKNQISGIGEPEDNFQDRIESPKNTQSNENLNPGIDREKSVISEKERIPKEQEYLRDKEMKIPDRVSDESKKDEIKKNEADKLKVSSEEDSNSEKISLQEALHECENEKRVDNKSITSLKDEIDNFNEIDIDSISDSLYQLIDIMNKNHENPDFQDLKTSIKEFHDLLRYSKMNPETGLLKGALEKIGSILDKLNIKNLSLDESLMFSNTLTGLKDLVAKIASRHGKRSNAGKINLNEIDNSISLKDLSNKIDVMLETLKGDGFSRSSGDEGSNSSNGFNFSFMKSDSVLKRSDITFTTQQKSSLFKESLHNIISNAKVIVKDSRNGSFTLKLYPENLGRVNINLGLEHGIVHGKFLVDTNEARDLLMENLEYIKSELRDAGITVGDFLVNVSDQGNKFFNEDEENLHIIPELIEADEIGSEYEINSRIIYDGAVDIVI